jgi:DNA-binding HxlR family transcriptional regulator
MAHCEHPARSPCPIAKTLDLLGDKWTLLVVRDLLFFGKRRFGELASSPEGIPTNILSDRLRRLEECGVLVKVPYAARPQRYEYRLTDRGNDLTPVLRAMIKWAQSHLPGTAMAPPPELMARATEAAAAALQPEASVDAPAVGLPK